MDLKKAQLTMDEQSGELDSFCDELDNLHRKYEADCLEIQDISRENSVLRTENDLLRQRLGEPEEEDQE